jgi:hypothetical protein
VHEPLEPAVVRDLVEGAFPVPKGSVVYADRVPVGPGVVTLGSVDHRLSVPAVIAFRDDSPGANWMHPCAYALVDLATGALLTTVDSDRPPVFGFLPDTWTVVSASDRVADLIRPSSSDEPENTEESSS